MIAIGMKLDIDKFEREVDDATRRQIPFALALTLTRTAQDARDYVRQHLEAHFYVRGSYVPRSFQATPAKKSDREPAAIIGSLYEPMALHAEGGEKTGSRGTVGVPVWARATKDDRTRPSRFPQRLAKRENFFLAPFSRTPFRVGRGVMADGVGLFQRIGRKKGKRHLKLWWTLHTEVDIGPDWPFENEVRAAVESELVDNFWAAMEYARATAKPSGPSKESSYAWAAAFYSAFTGKAAPPRPSR